MDMRILAIDYGDKNLGLAISDRLQITAQGLEKYRLRSKKEDLDYFKDLVTRFEIAKIVMGLPLRMDGSTGSRVDKTKAFALWLEESLSIPVVYWDERLTTKEAFRILREQGAKPRQKKQYKDQISASLILESYLENERSKSHVD
jgi:putative Holliday junction resolvase